jgi:hypothetical protein
MSVQPNGRNNPMMVQSKIYALMNYEITICYHTHDAGTRIVMTYEEIRASKPCAAIMKSKT